MMIELAVSVSAEPVHNRHPTTSVNLRQTDLSLRLQLPQRLSNASLPSVQDRRTPTPRVTPAPDNLRQPLKKRVPTAPRDLSCHFKRTLSTRKQLNAISVEEKDTTPKTACSRNKRHQARRLALLSDILPTKIYQPLQTLTTRITPPLLCRCSKVSRCLIAIHFLTVSLLT